MRAIKPTKLLSTCCRRCRWFENKTNAKRRGIHLTLNSFGVCKYGNGMELFEMQVANGPVPCPQFVFKPCSGMGDSYIVINTMSGVVLYTTPIVFEAKSMAAKYNNPDIIVAKITKVD